MTTRSNLISFMEHKGRIFNLCSTHSLSKMRRDCVLFGDAESEFDHRQHKSNEENQINRHDFEADRVADQPEEGRKESRTDICARHLYADDRARVFRAEILWRRMNDTRVNGGATESDHDECNDRYGI